jgi:hypothetical protein
MRDFAPNPHFLGFVQVRCGKRVLSLPIEAMAIHKDLGTKRPGGFFTDGQGACGILVDGEASAAAVRAQIEKGIADAVAHLSRATLN